MNKFSYSNKKIKDNLDLYSDKNNKNITLIAKDGTTYNIHDAVITNEFVVLNNMKE